MIQTEVEFVEMYEDQPLFGDVDRLLRGAGFQFHTFEGFGKRCFKPLVANNDLNRGLRQILWSDAVYVRDFMEFESVQEDKPLKLVLMLHDLFHSCDLCLYILTEIDRRAATDHVQRYREAFADSTPV